jgi:VanZ family protein
MKIQKQKKTKNMNILYNLPLKRKISFVCFSILSILILWFIFSHSAKPAIESSGDSEGLSLFVANLINKIAGTSLTDEDTAGVVRTFAHFAEFGAFSFCVYGAISSLRDTNRITFICSFITTFFVSLIDETVQIFFEGRAFQISDIFIDSLGGLVGIIFFVISIRLFSRKKTHTIKNNRTSTPKDN